MYFQIIHFGMWVGSWLCISNMKFHNGLRMAFSHDMKKIHLWQNLVHSIRLWWMTHLHTFPKEIWLRSWNCGCLVTWFCYQLIAKPGNKTATVSWPDPYITCFQPDMKGACTVHYIKICIMNTFLFCFACFGYGNDFQWIYVIYSSYSSASKILTHCCLGISNGFIELGQHWSR